VDETVPLQGLEGLGEHLLADAADRAPQHLNRAYELSGDTAWSFAEYADELSRQTGRTITYDPVPAGKHLEILTGAGVPAPFAAILVDVDQAIVRGVLARTTGDLARLIGRPTTPLADSVAEALASPRA
jgi:NAD(P)H dehydrogenase (quinone)